MGTQKLPKSVLANEEYLCETEVQTRISQVLHKFKLLDLHSLDWDAKFDDLGLDEYEQTAILTSIEHEFHTIFEDNRFDHFTNFNEVAQFISTDHNCF